MQVCMVSMMVTVNNNLLPFVRVVLKKSTNLLEKYVFFFRTGNFV
jgi:hypothetical protein